MRLVALDDLLRDIVDHGLLNDERGGVKHTTVYALLYHLPNSGLGQAPQVHRFSLLSGGLPPLNERRLHVHHDGAVIGYLLLDSQVRENHVHSEVSRARVLYINI